MNKKARILSMLLLCSAFFIVELVVGYISGSVALLADAFHMLSDMLSLVVAYYAVKLAERKSYKAMYTYGWQRAETLGALINGVFLIALCVSIIIEAIKRFFMIEEIENPTLVLYTGVIGLLVNILGMFMFHGHGHGHHHHHHEDEYEDASMEESIADIPIHPAESYASVMHAVREQKRAIQAGNLHSNGDELVEDTSTSSRESERIPLVPEDATIAVSNSNHSTYKNASGKSSHHHHEGASNMHGIFLHVLGDALGSVGVILSAIFIVYTDYSWKFYVDPIASLVLTAIILFTTVPLVKNVSFILLQAAPTTISVSKVRRTIEKIPGVYDLHELHIWQLSDTKAVASVHFVCEDIEAYLRIGKVIRSMLHKYSIHSTTLQPEFLHPPKGENGHRNRSDVGNQSSSTGGTLDFSVVSPGACLLTCEQNCETKRCCPAPSVSTVGVSLE